MNKKNIIKNLIGLAIGGLLAMMLMTNPKVIEMTNAVYTAESIVVDIPERTITLSGVDTLDDYRSICCIRQIGDFSVRINYEKPPVEYYTSR